MNYPKPSALKIIEGNRGRRPINENEPKPPRIMPSIPFKLNDKAKAIWEANAPLYFELGLLNLLNARQFAMNCEIDGEIEEFKKDIEDNGYTYIKVTVDGAGIEYREEKDRSVVRRLAKWRDQSRIGWGLFGGNPSTISKLTGNPIIPKKGTAQYLT